MKLKFKLLTLLSILMMILSVSCGNGTSNNSSSSDSHSDSYSDSNIGQYVGKWELFQAGLNPDNPSETGLFTLTIRSNGDASIKQCVSSLGAGTTIIASGDGRAELNGDVLFVEITSGESAGSTLSLKARNGELYTADGETFSKSY